MSGKHNIKAINIYTSMYITISSVFINVIKRKVLYLNTHKLPFDAHSRSSFMLQKSHKYVFHILQSWYNLQQHLLASRKVSNIIIKTETEKIKQQKKSGIVLIKTENP